MPIYHRLGTVPRKRHIAFRGKDGRLQPEELIGNEVFTGPSSLLYHLHQPTQVKSVRLLENVEWKPEPEPLLRHRHFRTGQLEAGPSIVLDRVPLLFNAEVAFSIAQPQERAPASCSRWWASCPSAQATTWSSRGGFSTGTTSSPAPHVVSSSRVPGT